MKTFNERINNRGQRVIVIEEEPNTVAILHDEDAFGNSRTVQINQEDPFSDNKRDTVFLSVDQLLALADQIRATQDK